MITRARIQNSRCLRDVDLTLAPLTILVGSNASGKSALLSALRGDLGTRWQYRSDLKIELKLFFEDGSARHKGTGGSDPRWPWKNLDAQLLQLDLQHLRSQNQVQAEHRLNTDGGNLANVFATLSRKQQIAVAEELCRVVPMFADVDIRPTGSSGHHQIVFQDHWNETVWYTPREVSDGTMLMLAFLILPYQEPPVELLCIEEPERGLHPYLLEQLMAMLRGLAHGAYGPHKKPIQVILATHSPELLDYAEPGEVRFLRRSPSDGSVLVEEAPTQSPDWERSFEIYRRSLGEAWLSGGLGGVPGA